MSNPENASNNESGFRLYSWPGGDTDLHRKYEATEPANVVSVTAARSVIGIAWQLQSWQINNVVNLATGQRRAEWRDYSKSTRGRLIRGYKKDGPFPGEFVRQMLDTKGDEEALRDVRAWLKATADEPRDIAAVRGSVVHKLIEIRAPLKALNEEVIRWYINQQWETEGRKVFPEVTDDDVDFVGNAMANYWDMRADVPFVVLAQEPQVWNLKAGYAGSADVMLWFLPSEHGDKADIWQRQANRGEVTVETVGEIGGTLGLGDWKTSPEVYTGHVVQGTAYMAAQFVGRNGIIDDRLSRLLRATMHGLIIKVRPDGWEVDTFPYSETVSHAFFGEIALARFLMTYDKPTELFSDSKTGAAKENWRKTE